MPRAATDHDAAGQDLVAFAGQLLNPGADRGMTRRGDFAVTGPHDVGALLVRAGLGVERTHDGKLVGQLGQPWQILTEFQASHLRINRLALPLRFGARFGVERLELAHRAAHEQVNHPFCFLAGARRTQVSRFLTAAES